MNRSLMTALVGGAFMMSAAPSYALVRLVKKCETSDGKYSMTIMDNQGIGPVRTSHFGAQLRDSADNVVGSWALTYRKSSGSISFGHPSFIDTKTGGKEFVFNYPSTNTPTSIYAVLPADQTEIRYGFRFDQARNEGNVVCSI